jgi:hypothetical protein
VIPLAGLVNYFGLLNALIAAGTALKPEAACAEIAGKGLNLYVLLIIAGDAAEMLARMLFAKVFAWVAGAKKFILTALPVPVCMRNHCGR